MRLTLLKVIQLLMIIPVTWATVYPLVFGGFALWSMLAGGTDHNYWPAFYMLGSAFSVICLWVAIISEPETVKHHNRAFVVVLVGLGFGCVLAILVTWLQFRAKYSLPSFTIYYYGFPLLLGVIHLARIARTLRLQDAPTFE